MITIDSPEAMLTVYSLDLMIKSCVFLCSPPRSPLPQSTYKTNTTENQIHNDVQRSSKQHGQVLCMGTGPGQGLKGTSRNPFVEGWECEQHHRMSLREN